MCSRQYEDFLIEAFLSWSENRLTPGSRFQFKSPDSNNSKKLYDAFLRRCNENYIDYKGQQLSYVEYNAVKLLPVLHSENGDGYSENYISHLRDLIASRSNEFSCSALFIIHNSMLDTLINSSLDVASYTSVWNPDDFANKLLDYIKFQEKFLLFSSLIADQRASIIEEGATVFGYEPLYHSIENGRPNYKELGLFNDAVLDSMNHENQIKNRLEENRKFRRDIESQVENFGDQLELVLQNFKLSTSFVKQHFYEQNDWQDIDFGLYLQEQASNKSQKLLFERIEADRCNIIYRAKSASKSGQRDISVIIEVPRDSNSIELVFVFNGSLRDGEFTIKNNISLRNVSELSVSHLGGKFARLKAEIPFANVKEFFSIDLSRENSAEEYKFRCIIVPENTFYFDEIKNNFRIEPAQKQITLQLSENILRISPFNDVVFKTQEDLSSIDKDQFGIVDFEDQAIKNEIVKFEVRSGEENILFNIEGPSASESISLPIIFDVSKLSKLFNDNSNAEFNKSKRKVIFENTEFDITGLRLQLLEYENDLISEYMLYSSDNGNSVNLEQIKDTFPELHYSYLRLFEYYISHKTLPSLAAWSSSYRKLIKNVIDSYENSLKEIPINRVLSGIHRKLMKIGRHNLNGQERLSPLHPLVLSYHLSLTTEIENEFNQYNTFSFTELPAVTLDRLQASGLLPFIPHAEHDFAYMCPLKENRFWINIIPQKDISYDYVRRLVRDKLIEFIEAYRRLFYDYKNTGPLVINAIHQGRSTHLFFGIIDYLRRSKDRAIPIHVNIYDDKIQQTDFDKFAESGKLTELKSWLELNTNDLRYEADIIIDLIRSKLTFSKYRLDNINSKLEYAHLAFFKNTAPVECCQVNSQEMLSGILANGLISGEAAETQEDSYFTAFGTKNIDCDSNQLLRISQYLNCLWGPSVNSNSQYTGLGLGLAVGSSFRGLLSKSYDSALWTTIIDPKVTLDFFTNQPEIVLIHYSDQYTSSSGYDAITVTKQIGLFKKLLDVDVSSDKLLSEFNAFNGEWLLKMLTAPPKDRKEKQGIIGAYKFINSILKKSDIIWIPLSVAEMIRVSGNIGLRMDASEFSRHNHGYKKGAISDDVLFVGFYQNTLYILPLEVKTGVRPDFAYAGQQALELSRYLKDQLLSGNTLASQLYRALFVRQVLMQLEKLRLYGVFEDTNLNDLLSRREWWLQGHYNVSALSDYADAIVLAHVDVDTFTHPKFEKNDDNILIIQLPIGLLTDLISAQNYDDINSIVRNCHVPQEFMLNSELNITPNAPVTPQLNQAETNLESYESEECRNPIPSESLKILLGKDQFRNQDLYWEPTNTSKFMNTNTGIIGTMGTGKTQFTKSMVAQLIRNQDKNVNSSSIGLLIFDYKSDYNDDEFCLFTNAKKLKLYKLPYNPLSLYGDMPVLPLHTAAGFSDTMSKAFRLGNKQKLRLKNLIIEAYERVGIYANDKSTWVKPAPTLSMIWDIYIAQERVEEDSLYAALDSLVQFQIFEPDQNSVSSLYDILENVLIIDLAQYPPPIQNLVVALTLDLFYSQMQKRGKPKIEGDYRQITKMILVDEADNFMKEDFDSLRKILKEGREYGVGVILSTQDISHFKTGENNYATYILTWIVHRVSEIRNADIKAIFNKDDRSEQEDLMETIRKLEKHYSLYVDGDKKIQRIRDQAFWELPKS